MFGFVVDLAASDNTKWTVFPTDELCKRIHISGAGSTYHIVPCRILGIPYNDYIVYMMKNYDVSFTDYTGEIVFKSQNQAKKFCGLLNERFNKLFGGE